MSCRQRSVMPARLCVAWMVLVWLGQGNSGSQATEMAVGLIDAFGELAFSALLDRGFDTKIPNRRRATALAAVASRWPPEQVDRLREEYGIYIVKGGRINVAGITTGNMDYLCDAIAAVV